MSRTLGDVLDCHVDEMCARTDIIWSDLDRFLAEQEKTSADKEAAKALRGFMAGMYDALMENQRAVIEALPWKPEQP
jgi:uncharacterized small protein (DUF1192 family)